jgi:hypothetical protein
MTAAAGPGNQFFVTQPYTPPDLTMAGSFEFIA